MDNNNNTQQNTMQDTMQDTTQDTMQDTMKDTMQDNDLVNNFENKININNMFKGKWYVINSRNHHEEKIKKDIIKRVFSCNIKDYVFDVRTVGTKVLNKKTKKMQYSNLYPGYIFINAIMTNEVWYIIRNTQGVLGFIGSSGKGVKPFPLSREEAIKMLEIFNPKMKKTKQKIIYEAEYKINDYVKIVSGLFNKEEGKVIAMDYNKGIATIEIEIFGRLTPTKIEFSSCKKIK